MKATKFVLKNPEKLSEDALLKMHKQPLLNLNHIALYLNSLNSQGVKGEIH